MFDFQISTVSKTLKLALGCLSGQSTEMTQQGQIVRVRILQDTLSNLPQLPARCRFFPDRKIVVKARLVRHGLTIPQAYIVAKVREGSKGDRGRGLK